MPRIHTQPIESRGARLRSMTERRTYDILQDNVLVLIPSLLTLFAMGFAAIRYCDLHDYYAYYMSYMNYHEMRIEPGYTLLENLFFSQGYPFYVFYGVSIVTVLILTWRFCMRNAQHRLLVVVLFFIYPYINILQQLRSAIGSAIVITALECLLSDEEKPIKYCACIALAMLFHSTSAIYLLFLLAVRCDLRQLRRLARWSFLLVIPSISIIRLVFARIIALMPYWAMKYAKYVTEGSGIGRAALVDWGIFLCMFLVLELAVEGVHDKLRPRDKKLVSICYVILVLSLLRGVGNNTYRLALMMYPVMYVAFDKVASMTEDGLACFIAYAVLILFPVVSLFVWWGPANPSMHMIAMTEMWRVWEFYYI